MIGVIEEIIIHKIKPSSNLSYLNPLHLETKELENSIKEHGLLQPIIIRTVKDNFEIVSGNRRYFACKNLGWRKILCHIVELDNKSAFEVSLTENIQRKTLDPLEEAKAFKLYVHDFGFGGIADLASRIGKSSSYICKRLNLLELPSELLQEIQNSNIKPSIAEEILPIRHKEDRKEISKIIIKNKLSTKETRELVNNFKHRSLSYDKNNSETENIDALYINTITDMEILTERSFDKIITLLKITLNRTAKVIEDIEENWIIYEILMQHKNMLNRQIDILIKEKKKLRK